MAKKALHVAHALDLRASSVEAEIRAIQRENHLGQNVRRALRGGS